MQTYIRADGDKVILHSFNRKHYVKVPLSLASREVIIQNGHHYLGWLREGVIWISKWQYKAEKGTLFIVAQTKGA